MRASPWILAVLLARTAAADPGWETVSTGRLRVTTRDRAHSRVKEVRVETDLDAPAYEVQNALLDMAGAPRFIPYMRESRFVGAPLPDGTRLVYARLELPLVAPRDYVVRMRYEHLIPASGEGEFKSSWVAVPDAVAERQGHVRLRLDDGSWQVTARPDGKAHVVYWFVVDPGGWIPGFIINIGNTTGLGSVMDALEKEANRRASRASTQASVRALD